MQQLSRNDILMVIGILTIAYALYVLASFITTYLRPSSIRKYRTSGAFALITGATDGIGKAIAFELASMQFNLILHGRSQEKLEAISREILKVHTHIKIRYLIQDSSINNPPDITAIRELPITVLVNNVGVGPIKELARFTETEIDATINVNILFSTRLTYHLLPVLARPSLILNISSYAGLNPPPYLAIYAATKAYNNAFSKSLSLELEGIESISILTGGVHTGSNKKPVSFLRPSSEVFAKSVLRVVGCGKKSVMPYWPHAVQLYLLSLLPERTMDKAIKKAMQREVKNAMSNSKQSPA